MSKLLELPTFSDYVLEQKIEKTGQGDYVFTRDDGQVVSIEKYVGYTVIIIQAGDYSVGGLALHRDEQPKFNSLKDAKEYANTAEILYSFSKNNRVWVAYDKKGKKPLSFKELKKITPYGKYVMSNEYFDAACGKDITDKVAWWGRGWFMSDYGTFAHDDDQQNPTVAKATLLDFSSSDIKTFLKYLKKKKIRATENVIGRPGIFFSIADYKAVFKGDFKVSEYIHQTFEEEGGTDYFNN